jgi:AraC-like DNA-binding protein
MWAHRIHLTADEAIFAGQEASLMRELIESGKWPDGRDDKEALPEPVSLQEQVLLVQRLGIGAAQAVAERFGLLDFGPVGAVVLASKDLRAAVRVMNSFAPLLNLRHAIMLSASQDDVIMTFQPYLQDLPSTWDSLLFVDVAKVLRFLRDLAGTGQLRSDGCARVPRLPELLGDVDSSTGAPRLCKSGREIRIPKALLGRKQPLVMRADASLYLKACRKMMHGLRERTLCSSVRRILFRCPECVPSQVQMAAKLGVSTRTFRRHLANQGTTFMQILDDVRFELAIRYLEDQHLTTDLIAQKLGYSESANFRAAFRRWTGSSPRHFNVLTDVRARAKLRVTANDTGQAQCV